MSQKNTLFPELLHLTKRTFIAKQWCIQVEYQKYILFLVFDLKYKPLVIDFNL